MEQYDIIIVGAGPAGLCLARELASTNMKILMLDKKKSADDVQYNTSGSFINAQEWGIPHDCLHPIHETYFASAHEFIRKKGIGNIINRKRLLKFLEQEARKNKNLTIIYNAAVVDVGLSGNHVESVTYIAKKKKTVVSARLYVDCSGVSAIIGKKIGLAPAQPRVAVGCEYIVPLKTEKNTADLFIGSNFKGGYGWIFPLNEKTAVVGWGSLLPETFPHVEIYLKEMWDILRVKERCVLKPFKKDVAVFRTGMPLKKFNCGNVVIIGDTALQGNPLVGEGIRFVMDAARMAAIAMQKNNLQLYDQLWKKKYYTSYKLGFMMQKRIVSASLDDTRLDFGVRRLRNMKDTDFKRLLSGDLSYWFLFRLGWKSMLKMLWTNIF